MKNKITVIGAGAWGTTLANLLAKNNHQVCLIANKQEIADEINLHKTNHKFLPEINLANNLKSATNLVQEIVDANFIFIVTPSNATAKLLQEIAQLKVKNNYGLVLCNKGLHDEKLQLFHQLIEEILPAQNYAILSGPNFALEVAKHSPTITTIAAKNLDFANEICNLLNNEYFCAQASSDVVAVEVCGVVKNIIAIACGIIDGLDLGQNAKAAAVVKGVKEIEVLCQKFSSNAQINNAAGFGDIFLTCASTKSRNNSLGFKIAQGENVKKLLNEGKTFEGANAALSLEKLSLKLGVNLELCGAIAQILRGDFGKKELQEKIITTIL